LRISPNDSSRELIADTKATGDSTYVPKDGAGLAELDGVVAVANVLTGRLNVSDVLSAAVSEVARIIGAEGSSILLIDPQTQGMSFHVAAGPGAEAAKTVPLPPGEGICGHVARSGQPLIVNDAQADARRYRRVDKISGVTTRNLLAAPLRSSERLWGVLELINKHDGADFDQTDLRRVEAVAGQLALALENAHLHTEIVKKERLAAVGQTVSGLAHCIRNILNGIRSGSAVVEHSVNDGNMDLFRKGWGVVRKNNDMLTTLVLDMLSLARETSFHPFPTDVNDLAEQISKLLQDRGAERGIRITFTPAEDLQEVVTDPTQVYRCLLNLTSNAVEACEEGGTVRVQVDHGRGRDRFTLSVLDNGMGIGPEIKAKMFTEFFTTKGNKGTGLGLAVSRKLITALGGTITFHSVAGRGTRFVVALPIGGPAEPEKETT